MIASLLGEVSQSICSVRQITEIMFAYLGNRLSTARSAEINKIAADETIRSLFAHGMHEFYIKNGWPDAPFNYAKLNFFELMKQRLAQRKESGTWEVALQLSKVLFGDREAPTEVDDAAVMYIRPILGSYKSLLGQAGGRYAYDGMKFTSEGLLDHSRIIVNCYAAFRSWAAL